MISSLWWWNPDQAWCIIKVGKWWCDRIVCTASGRKRQSDVAVHETTILNRPLNQPLTSHTLTNETNSWVDHLFSWGLSPLVLVPIGWSSNALTNSQVVGWNSWVSPFLGGFEECCSQRTHGDHHRQTITTGRSLGPRLLVNLGSDHRRSCQVLDRVQSLDRGLSDFQHLLGRAPTAGPLDGPMYRGTDPYRDPVAEHGPFLGAGVVPLSAAEESIWL